MAGINITLHRNKEYDAVNEEGYKVIAGENNATTISVQFPEEYENFSKKVDFMNIRKEKWSIPLYMPEDETRHYDDGFDKLNFSFTLPTQVTVNGEMKMQFVAYLPDETETIVPFEIIVMEIRDSILYARKQSSENPDIILRAYEYANMALETARESLAQTTNAERAALEAEKSAKNAENSSKASQQSATEAQKSAESANTRATNAEASAKASQENASKAEKSAKNAENSANTAVSTSNTANSNSQNAVNTANQANSKSTQALDIVENLTVDSTEIDCTEHVSVEIETSSDTKRKNIHFDIPAPKQGKSYRSKGPWESTTQYLNDEYFIDTVSRHGCTYFCKKTNTNQEPIASAESDYWGLLAIKGNDAGITIVDALDSTHSDYSLSAKQGKVLNDNANAQKEEINKIKNNQTIIANSNGGFSCGSGATNGKGMQFKGFTICDENGKIPVARLFDAIYPIGSIYISSSSTNPGTLFGGTWEAYAQGRTLFGNGTSDKSFSAGSTGGESNHTLSVNEMPSHTHTQNSHNHTQDSHSHFISDAGCHGMNGNGSRQRYSDGDSQSNKNAMYTGSAQPSINGTVATNQNTGGGASHNNLPPYIVTYIWRRTA